MQQFVLNNRTPFVLKLCLPNRRQDAEAENDSRLNLVLKDKLYIKPGTEWNQKIIQ